MATKNEIVGQLFTSKEFNDCIAKMEPAHLQDDLRAEVVLILLETPDDKIELLHLKGELKFYTVRIILNLIQSPRSKFYKQYRLPKAEITDRFTCEETDMNEREGREQLEERALSEIEKLYWYDRDMVKLYLEVGNYRAIEQATSIPYSSAYKTVQKSIKAIKQKILQ